MMRAMYKFIYFIICAAPIFLLTSCDGDRKFKDLREDIEKLKQQKIAAKDTVAQSKKIIFPTAAKYESSGRRSPFTVIETTTTAKGLITSNPLQAYPLDMLRFVGTVTQDDVTIAFVTAPDNKIYQIKVGDEIGDRQSQVVSINSDNISLTEEVSENGNAPMKRVVTLQLKEASQ